MIFIGLNINECLAPGGYVSVFELINEIDNEDIVLPAIQRDFVWEEGRVEKLFDSIFRGYPVGIALLWETYEPLQYRTFSRHHATGSINQFKDNKKGKRIKLVLDGQQRLSSLYVGLRGSFDGKLLYYDVLSGNETDDHSEVKYRFMFATTAEAEAANKASSPSRDDSQAVNEPEYWVHLSDVVGANPKDLIALRKTISNKLILNDDAQLRLELNIATANYSLSDNAEILKTQTIDSKLPAGDQKRKTAFDILEIFVRINTQGMTLRRSDLIVSMLRLYWPEASDVIPKFIKSVNASGSMSIDNDFVIRCMFSTAGLGTRLDFDLLRKKSNVERIQQSYVSCFDAIGSAIDFVRSDCGLDSTKMIGGLNTLVPFVHYLYSAPKHSFPHNNKADAKRALYLFAFAKAFTQHSESRTAAFIRDYLPSREDITQGAGFPLNGALVYCYWKGAFSAPDIRLFGNNAELGLSLVQRKSGSKINFVSNVPEIDHIFPRATLADKSVDWQEINDMANLWIIPLEMNRNKSAKHPKEFLKTVDDKTLEDAFIDRELLNFNLFSKFLRSRRAALTLELQKITGLNDKSFASLLQYIREQALEA